MGTEILIYKGQKNPNGDKPKGEISTRLKNCRT